MKEPRKEVKITYHDDICSAEKCIKIRSVDTVSRMIVDKTEFTTAQNGVRTGMGKRVQLKFQF